MALPNKISLRVNNGQYVCAENSGGQNLVANRGAIGPWETFTLIDRGNGQVAFQASNGQYVCAENGGGAPLTANRGGIGPWETFTLIDLGNRQVAFKACNGLYVSADGGGGQTLSSRVSALGPWETFGFVDMSYAIPARTGQYDWSVKYTLPQPGRGAVTFTAVATNDVHIAISPAGTVDPMYEIVIGGWGNGQSVIRRASQGAQVVAVPVGLSAPACENPLWVAIDSVSKVIQVGRGMVGQNIIMSFHDPNFIATAQNVAFSSWNTPITYGSIATQPVMTTLGFADNPSTAVSLGNPAKLNITGKISVTAWIFAQATDGLRNIVSRGYVLSPNGELYLRLCNGNYQFGSWDGNDHVVSVPIPAGDINTWVHLAGTYDGATWSLYRNGTLLAQAGNPVGAVPVAAGWSVGSRGDQIERLFRGFISDVSIWNIPLTAFQLASCMAGSLAGSEAGLLGYWPLRDGDGAAAGDRTASPANGTLTRNIWTLLTPAPMPAAPVPSVEQVGWSWCNKCQGLFYASTPSACPAGGAHNGTGSNNYHLYSGSRPDLQGQPLWRWCNKCSGLYYSGSSNGLCAKGGAHDPTGSGNYVLTQQELASVTKQDQWVWCNRCQGLYFSGNPQNACPAGGAHDHTGSGNYQLKYEAAPPPVATSGSGASSGGLPPATGNATLDSQIAQLVNNGVQLYIFGVPFKTPFHFSGNVQTTVTADVADFIGTAHIDSPFSADIARFEARVSRTDAVNTGYLRFDLPVSLGSIIQQQVQPKVPAAAWTAINLLVMPYLNAFNAPTVILSVTDGNDDQLGPIVKGINFYRSFKLSDIEPFATLNSAFSVLHLDQRNVVLHVGAGREDGATNWQADASLVLNQSLGTDTVVLRSLSLTVKPGTGTLSAGVQALMTIKVSDSEVLNITGGVNVNKGDSGASMTLWGALDVADGTWHNPLGLKGLHIKGLGIEIGAATVFPFIVLGFRGDVYIGDAQLHATLAFFFNPADIGSTVLQVSSPEGINLVKLLTALLPLQFLPKDIFNVSLTDLNFFISPKGGTIAGKSYAKGAALGGKINLWGYKVSLDGLIDYSTGGYLRGSMDRISLSAGNVKFIELTDAAGTGSPAVNIELSSQAAAARITGKINIFNGYYAELVDISASSSGFSLTLSPNAGGIYASTKVSFDGSGFSLSVSPGFRYGFSLFGQDISVGVTATVSIRISAAGFYQSLSFSFSAFGSDHSAGTVSWSVPLFSIDDLKSVFNQFGDVVKDFFTKTLAGGALEAVNWVKNNVTNVATQVASLFKAAGADSIQVAQGLVNSFGMSAEDAAKTVASNMEEAGRILKDGFGKSVTEVGNFFRNAYGAADSAVNTALNSVGYAADQVNGFMHDAFSWFPHVDFPFADGY